jgi:hypothetical protein
MEEKTGKDTSGELSDLLRQTIREGRGILGELADANRQLDQSARELCDSLNRLICLPPPRLPRRRGLTKAIAEWREERRLRREARCLIKSYRGYMALLGNYMALLGKIKQEAKDMGLGDGVYTDNTGTRGIIGTVGTEPGKKDRMARAEREQEWREKNNREVSPSANPPCPTPRTGRRSCTSTRPPGRYYDDNRPGLQGQQQLLCDGMPPGVLLLGP